MKRIIITTGDANGIGLEITIKALLKIGPKKGFQFIFFRDSGANPKPISLLKKKFKVISCKSLKSALQTKPLSNHLIEIVSSKNPTLWFEGAVHAANDKLVAALVTAPLSKQTIQKAGLKDAGHTDIMKRITKRPVKMAFWGKHFSLLLFSDHVSLKDVPKQLTKRRLLEAVLAANTFLKLNRSKGKIGVLGLNPHAGEIARLGREENKIILPVLKMARRRGVAVEGPLVPDVAFQPNQLKKYKIFVAMYHDQGLIPFKIYHKNNHGIQVSINLPFVRTSVDHGTAKDLFGKNAADPRSMFLAIKKAIVYLK